MYSAGKSAGKLLEIDQLLNGSCEDLTDEESLRKDALEEYAAAYEAPAARQYTEEELVKMSRHRRAIYREIRQSEGEYVQALKMMLNTYKKPLLQKKNYY